MLKERNEEVVCSFRYPDWVCHEASQVCGVEWPHLIAECGEFDV